MVIITRYEETKEKLRKMINQGTINAAEVSPQHNACYFCLKPIKSRCWELLEEDVQGTSSYCIDDGCYREARSSFYVHGAPFPIN